MSKIKEEYEYRKNYIYAQSDLDDAKEEEYLLGLKHGTEIRNYESWLSTEVARAFIICILIILIVVMIKLYA